MRLRNYRILFLLAVGVIGFAAEHAATPLLELGIADGDRLNEHWKSSLYGKLWNDPALAELRAKADQAIDQANQAHDLHLADLALALKQAHFTLIGFSEQDPPKPLMIGQADLGADAAKLFSLLAKQGTPATVAGADEAMTDKAGEVTVARFGSTWVLGSAVGVALKPHATAAQAHDLELAWDGAAFATFLTRTVLSESKKTGKGADLVAEGQRAQRQLNAILALCGPLLAPMHSWMDLTPDGFTSQSTLDATVPWLIDLDPALLARLPANAYSVSAIALDGRRWWNDLHAALFTAIASAKGETRSAAEIEHAADQALGELGLTCTVGELVSGIHGTFIFANSQAAPFPGFTFSIPRSPGMDQVAGLAVKRLGVEIPAEGESVLLPIPNMPISLNLIRDPKHWILSTDPALVATWSSSAPGGWLDTPIGKLAQANLGKGTCCLSVTDSPTELRTYLGFLSMGMGAIPWEPKQKQALMQGFNRLILLSTNASTVVKQDGKRLTVDSKSLLGFGGASVAIIAAIVVPNLLESRITANEAAAAASLKSGVFPAEVQFQAGGYHDRDNNGIGDFGFFAEMAGGPIPGAKPDLTLSLLAPAWNKAEPEINGYRFAVYLPDGKGGALDAAHDGPVPAGGKGAETNFVAYAWPIDGSKGRRMFALTAAGSVFATPPAALTGEAPKWNDLFGGEGKGWDDAPVWKVYRR